MSNYTGLLILNLFLGIGMGLTMPNLPKLAAGWFQPAQRGIVMSIYSTGISTGACLGLMLTLPVIYKIVESWNKVFFVWGAVTVIIALLTCLLIRNYPDFKSIESLRNTGNNIDYEVYKNKHLRAVAAAFFCLCWINYSYIGWIPTIVNARGASVALGGAMAGILYISGFVANMVSPTLSAKLNRRAVFIWESFVVGVFVTIGVMFAPMDALWILFPLLGLILNTPYAISVFMMPLDLFPREKVGASTGMIFTVGYFAALVGPFASGKIMDITGNINSVMISFILVYVIGAIIGFFFIPDPLGSRDSVQRPIGSDNKLKAKVDAE
jgi:CP family cyanate transporter-like MFS transporter